MRKQRHVTDENNFARIDQRLVVLADVVAAERHQLRMVLDADRVPGRRRVPVNEAGEAGGQVARTGTDVQHLAVRLQVRLQQLQCVRVLAREMENVFLH